MTNEFFENVINEVKSQITKLNLTKNFTLFKADEFGFTNKIAVTSHGGIYDISNGIEISHPLTGYHVLINTNVDNVEVSASVIIEILVNDFTNHFNQKK